MADNCAKLPAIPAIIICTPTHHPRALMLYTAIMDAKTSQLTVRELTERREESSFFRLAALASRSRGREIDVPPCPVRTCYQRDRDRILHTKAFRRLAHKTQVFLAPKGDHYRTRLTHTLEVSQISRTIARALALNEDLTEAIALGHDLGHTPFGHVGEEALAAGGRLTRPFRHNEQSLRVVEKLEYSGEGLNLTWEVRDGILNHTGPNKPVTLEGRIVRIADRIAYINHDIDDALRGGLITEDDLPSEPVSFFGSGQGARISGMVNDLVGTSTGRSEIRLSDEGWRLMGEMRAFLFSRVYSDSVAKKEDVKQTRVLQSLFDYFSNSPREMPAEFLPSPDDDPTVKVIDYVAGMTDRFAIKTYERLFVPNVWDAPGD